MANCIPCNREVPDASYLNPMVTSDGTIPDVCAVCALEISNTIHEEKKKKFDGEKAEELRLKTIKHYKQTNQMRL